MHEGGAGGKTSSHIVFSVVIAYGFHVMFVTWPKDRARLVEMMTAYYLNR